MDVPRHPTPCTCPDVCAHHPPEAAPTAGCNFCGLGPTEVAGMVAGPLVYICTECVETAIDLLAKRYGVDPAAVHGRLKADRVRRLRDHAARLAAEADAADPVTPAIGALRTPRGDGRPA